MQIMNLFRSRKEKTWGIQEILRLATAAFLRLENNMSEPCLKEKAFLNEPVNIKASVNQTNQITRSTTVPTAGDGQ